MKRYVAAMIRDAKTEEGLTEENFKVCSSIRANNEDCKSVPVCYKTSASDYVCKHMLDVNLVNLYSVYSYTTSRQIIHCLLKFWFFLKDNTTIKETNALSRFQI